MYGTTSGTTGSIDDRSRYFDTIHMKRTNLVLDERLLERAKAALGLKTYSETVNASLREVLRRRAFEQIDSYAGSDVWEGNLSEMREDRDVSR